MAHALVHPVPLAELKNIDCQYSLINSVDFHHRKNVFCATYTHNNKIAFYAIETDRQVRLVQTLRNPKAKLSDPQHALFSPDGKRVVVANWTNQTLTIYLQEENGLFSETPAAIIPPSGALSHSKPHGAAFSPCGNYLVIAYGAASYFEQGIALFESRGNHLQCIHMIPEKHLPGIPKGIAFSPDGTHLLVTFCDIHGLGIFSVHNQTIHPIPKQMVRGGKTDLFRPEDIKISPDGRYLAVSNSEHNTITFYPFDPKSNAILQNVPCYTLRNPEAHLSFPHGLAFSPDGQYLAITQFGPIQMTAQGDILWDRKMPSKEAAIHLYTLEK